jgi:hypothetical protein
MATYSTAIFSTTFAVWASLVLIGGGAILHGQAVAPVAALADADAEQPGVGPWAAYGTPVTLEKSGVARTGRQSLRVVTDNQDTMGGGFEGVSRYLGEYQVGDLIAVSFWFNTKAGQPLIAALGQTSFLSYSTFAGTDWTRADLALRCPRVGPYTLWISQVSAPTDFLLDDLTLEVVRRAQLGQAEKADLVSLTGGPLRLTLCRKSGALAGLENLATGETYAPVGLRQPLLGLQVLSQDGAGFENIPFARLRLQSVDVQPPTRATCIFAVADLPIEITVSVELKDDGAAEFRGRIRNDSERRVTACEMPMLVGVKPVIDPANLTLVHPDHCGKIVTNASQSLGCQTTWPGQGAMGWMDLSGEQGGIYLATHDESLTGTRLSGIPAPEAAFDLSLTREIVVRPKEVQAVPLAVLAVHAGDWHAAADRYRTWVQSWLPAAKLPQWIQEANGWVLVGLQNDVPFSQLTNYYRQAQWMGVEYLHVQGEGIDSMSAGPDGTFRGQVQMYLYPNPRLGGVEELKTAVRQVHELGGHVMFYFLYERWRPALSLADDLGCGKREDIPPDMQPPSLDFYYRNGLLESSGGKLPTEHPYEAERLMCLAAPGWQDWMAYWDRLYTQDYGADGFYWDVMGRNGPFRCFNSQHQHDGQNTWSAGSREILARTQKEGRKTNPDYACAIEGCSDVLGEFVGFHLMSGATQTPNVFRYTFPSYLCVDGFANQDTLRLWKMTQPQKARRVFLDGERFDLGGYHQQVKHIVDLRRRIKPFIDWPAVFKDTVGLKTSDPRIEARVFWRTDGKNKVMAVSMLNEQAIATATVEVDLSPIGQPRSVHLFGLDGRVEKLEPGAQGRQTLRVPPDQVSAAVIVSAVSPELAVVPWIEQITTPGEDGAVLSIFTPLGAVEGVRWTLDWPEGFTAEDASLPVESDCLRRIAFRDPAHLTGLKRWQKITAAVTWSGGTAQAWTMLCPPLVNGDFEEVEDGLLAYWPGKPCADAPGQGKYCIKLDRQSAPKKMLISTTPLKPNCTYRFKAMVKRTGVPPAEAPPAGAQVIEYEEGETFTRSAVLSAATYGTWETLQTTFTTHPNPRATAIYLYNFDPDHPVYYDGLELEEVR